jgi:hypothetical protein
VQVYGDAFIGRIFDNEDDFKRLDFRIGELSSSAPWVREAAEQAARRRQRADASAALQRMQQDAQHQRKQPARCGRQLARVCVFGAGLGVGRAHVSCAFMFPPLYRVRR